MFLSGNHGISIPIAVAIVFVLSWTPAASEDMKMGYINSQRIFESYQGTLDAESKFKEEVQNWEAEATSLRNEILDLEAELESQRSSGFLQQETIDAQKKIIDEKKVHLEVFVNEIWGSEGKVYKRNEELTQPIIEKINVILEKIGREENFAMVFNTVGGVLVYADPGLDLTDRVIEELNKETGENQ